MKAAGKKQLSVSERQARLDKLVADGKLSKEQAMLLHVREATVAEKAYAEGFAAGKRRAKAA